MKPLAPAVILVLALAGCATRAPQEHSAHTAAADGSRKAGGMMDEMCKRHAAEPGSAASAPGMMDKHCRAKAQAPAGAASHVH
jgi:hypothetical protein